MKGTLMMHIRLEDFMIVLTVLGPLFSARWARQLVQVRLLPDGPKLPRWLGPGSKAWPLWLLIGFLSGLLLAASSLPLIESIVFFIYGFALVALSAVDLAIRKIPNETLLVLILGRLVELIFRFDMKQMGASALGLLAGYFLLTIIAGIGFPLGRGDIKLAAVIGFCLGVPGLLQSLVILGLFSAIYLLLYQLTKRDNLKLKVAMGPFLAIGMIVSYIFPLQTLLHLPVA
jgi:leader peptidase (prepilin peptidase)/N-methyltransferase